MHSDSPALRVQGLLQVIQAGFGDPADQAAKEILQGLFPDREVVQIYARDILIGGGNIHCITQQVPV